MEAAQLETKELGQRGERGGTLPTAAAAELGIDCSRPAPLTQGVGHLRHSSPRDIPLWPTFWGNRVHVAGLLCEFPISPAGTDCTTTVALYIC